MPNLQEVAALGGSRSWNPAPAANLQPALDGPSLSVGFLAICRPLASDLVRRRELFIAEPDAPSVHAFRGALRRMRSAIWLFEAVLPSRDAKWLRRELKWLAGQLGYLRDLDVFLGRIEDAKRKTSKVGTHPVEGLVRAAKFARVTEMKAAIAASRSARACFLASALEGWLYAAASDLDPAKSLLSEVQPVLRGLDARLRVAGRDIARLKPRGRHALRSKVKTLRYAAEALSQVSGPDGDGGYVAALTELSHVLGDLNDDEVGAHLAYALSEGAGLPVSQTPSRRRRHAADESRLAAAWDRFISAGPNITPHGLSPRPPQAV